MHSAALLHATAQGSAGFVTDGKDLQSPRDAPRKFSSILTRKDSMIKHENVGTCALRNSLPRLVTLVLARGCLLPLAARRLSSNTT